MKLELWTLEKSKKNKQASDIEDYVKRLSHYTDFEMRSIDNSKIAHAKSSIDEIKLGEEKLILKSLEQQHFLLLLDEHGKELTSKQWAQEINKWQVSGLQKVIVLIGGSYGVSKAIKQRANLTLSLSKLTFPHRLVKLIIVEQVYRAFTILKGEKYHHE